MAKEHSRRKPDRLEEPRQEPTVAAFAKADAALDEALKQTFPASDPVALIQATRC